MLFDHVWFISYSCYRTWSEAQFAGKGHVVIYDVRLSVKTTLESFFSISYHTIGGKCNINMFVLSSWREIICEIKTLEKDVIVPGVKSTEIKKCSEKD